MENQPKQVGRPSLYSDALIDDICHRIANGESLRRICQDEGYPDRFTVLRWLGDPRYADFVTKYARARDAQADYLADEIQEVADHGNPEDVNRARLRVLTMQWRAAKLAPKKYGDKLDATLAGPNGGPIPFQRVERTYVDPDGNP